MASGTHAPEGIPVRPKYVVKPLDIRELFLVQKPVEIADSQYRSAALQRRISKYMNGAGDNSTKVPGVSREGYPYRDLRTRSLPLPGSA
jgi:hypothetical protein